MRRKARKHTSTHAMVEALESRRLLSAVVFQSGSQSPDNNFFGDTSSGDLGNAPKNGTQSWSVTVSNLPSHTHISAQTTAISCWTTPVTNVQPNQVTFTAQINGTSISAQSQNSGQNDLYGVTLLLPADVADSSDTVTISVRASGLTNSDTWSASAELGAGTTVSVQAVQDMSMLSDAPAIFQVNRDGTSDKAEDVIFGFAGDATHGDYLGDTNGDGYTNFQDLTTVSANYGASGPWIGLGNGDLTKDNTVNFSDLTIISTYYNDRPDYGAVDSPWALFYGGAPAPYRPGYYVTTIPAGQSSVTVQFAPIPIATNVPTVSPAIEMDLLQDPNPPATQVGADVTLAAGTTHPASTQPGDNAATQPGAKAAVRLWTFTVNTNVADQMGNAAIYDDIVNMGSDNPFTRNAATNDLYNGLIAEPSLHVYKVVYDTIGVNQVRGIALNLEQQIRLNKVFNTVWPMTLLPYEQGDINHFQVYIHTDSTVPEQDQGAVLTVSSSAGRMWFDSNNYRVKDAHRNVMSGVIPGWQTPPAVFSGGAQVGKNSVTFNEKLYNNWSIFSGNPPATSLLGAWTSTWTYTIETSPPSN